MNDSQFLLASALAVGCMAAYVAVRVREHFDAVRARERRERLQTQALWTAHMWRIAQVWRTQLTDFDLMRLRTDRRIIEETMGDKPHGPVHQ